MSIWKAILLCIALIYSKKIVELTEKSVAKYIKQVDE